jgi:nucleotide-binding universal stress UspA family protein
MAKKILVSLDETKEGEAIIPKLEELILRSMPSSETELTLLEVIPIVNFDVLTTDKRAQLPYTDEDKKELTSKATTYLEKIARNLQIKGFNVKTMVKIGPAAEEIVNAAHEINADLIAMATNARGGIIRWAIGSVSDRVIRLEGKIPVLAVHTKSKKEENSVFLPGSLNSLTKHS